MIGTPNEQGILLRPPRPEDAEDLYAVVTHPRVATTTSGLPTRELVETQEWADKNQPRRQRLVAVVDGRVVASGTLTQYGNPRRRHSAWLGLLVHPDYWGRGVGTSLTEALLHLADDWLGLLRVELEVQTENERAIKLYERCGFVHEVTQRKAIFGGDGRFHDVYVMARLAENAPEADANPRPSFLQRQDVTGVTIRPPRPEDAADIHEMLTHPAVGRTTNQYPSRELPSVQERMEPQEAGLHRFVAEVSRRGGTTKVVGHISLHQEQNPRFIHSAGMGMTVHPDYWGLGIGTKLLEAAVDLADNWLNLARFWLEVTTDNEPAIHLYEKFGFEREGTKHLYNFGDGHFHDVHVMARIR